jgi:MFS superfamily sulfate permease-like transporter
MSSKTSFETSLPEGVYVYRLTSPLTFGGLPRFVSAIIGERASTRVVIMSIDKNALAIESDLAAVDSATDRLFAHAILPLLVVPEGCDQVNRYFKRTTNIGIFKSMRAALNCAKSFLAAD